MTAYENDLGVLEEKAQASGQRNVNNRAKTGDSSDHGVDGDVSREIAALTTRRLSPRFACRLKDRLLKL